MQLNVLAQLPRFTPALLTLLFVGCGPDLAAVSGEEDELGDTSQPLAALSVPFERGLEGYTCFRTPAIVKANNGDLLAFAGGRKGGCDDDTDGDVVLRTSSNGGRSWKPLQVLDRGVGSSDNRVGLPNPVVLNDGTVLLLYMWSAYVDEEDDRGCRRVFIRRSTDHGGTWSARRDITSQVQRRCREDSRGRWVDPPAPGEWGWTGLGPTHGIVKQNEPHKGRIVVAGRHVGSNSKTYSHVIYSDDNGASWRIGGSLDFRSTEAAVVELPNGHLMVNSRSASGSRRVVGISRNGGASFENAYQDQSLVEPEGVQGSLLRYGDAILFSNPRSTTARTNGTVQVSRDNGATWSTRRRYTSAPEFSSYSGLVRVGGDVGVLVEWGPSEQRKHEQIRFILIPRADLGL
jgi:sialidase-1